MSDKIFTTNDTYATAINAANTAFREATEAASAERDKAFETAIALRTAANDEGALEQSAEMAAKRAENDVRVKARFEEIDATIPKVVKNKKIVAA